MMSAIVAGFTLSVWFIDAWGETSRYFSSMNTIQWGVVSACSVVFGFLCLKGSNANR
ncbi:MAG: hypothetical protein AB8B91_13610 [Rubripirellula sp.]